MKKSNIFVSQLCYLSLLREEIEIKTFNSLEVIFTFIIDGIEKRFHFLLRYCDEHVPMYDLILLDCDKHVMKDDLLPNARCVRTKRRHENKLPEHHQRGEIKLEIGSMV